MCFGKYGFRFFVSGMKDDMYGVKDLEDNITEFYSYDELISLSRKVKIMGVFDDTVNLEWFQGYLRREWQFKISFVDFVNKFGLVYDESDFGHIFYLCVILDSMNRAYFNFSFYEFVNSLNVRCCLKDGSNRSFPGNGCVSVAECEIKKVIKGVDFAYLIDNKFDYISVGMLDYFNFDKYALKSDFLSVYISCNASVFFRDIYIRSLRPIKIKTYAHGRMHLESISSSGGAIEFRSNSSDMIISEDFAKSVSFWHLDCTLTYTIYIVENECVLAHMFKTYDGHSILVGYMLYDQSQKYNCCIISSLDSPIEIDNYDTFVVTDSSDAKFVVRRSFLNKCREDSLFFRKHNITYDDFVRRCEYVG